MAESDYTQYLEFATESQRKCVLALQEHKSQRKAAKALGINYRTLTIALSRLKKTAILRGYSPEHDMVHTTPEGYLVKGVSTLYKEDGSKSIQWVKTSLDQDKLKELMQEAFDAFSETLPKAKPINPPHKTNTELLNLYVITDYHIGMYAWGEETGDDWDTNIAENLLINWFAQAIKMSPDSEVGIFAQLGDFLHWDGMAAITPSSGHLLDADTRFQRLVRISIKVIRKIISMLLEKHQFVHVIMAEGNHDTASSAWLREMFNAFLEHEPRVTVDISPDPYYCYEHGQTALFFHHGHKRRPVNISDVFVGKFREVFGRTKYAYAHMGHMHHIEEKENSLMVVKQHRTLAAKDAYASRGGWLSGREAEVITYHKKFGKVGAITLTPEMIREQAA